MAHAEVPGVRLTGDGQRTDDGGGVRVHKGQRRDRVMRTPWPAAATRNVHDRRLSCENVRTAADTRIHSGQDAQPLPSPGERFAQLPARPAPDG
jgi:hypothetical protein